MPQETVLETEKPGTELDKLSALFNEEIYLRADINNVQVGKLKTLDELISYYKNLGKLEEVNQKLQDQLKEHPESVSFRYMRGIISLVQNKIEDSNHLKSLLEQFKIHGRWTIVEYITEQMLQFGDQRLALKFKAEALEKLNKQKELKLVLEKLAKHDRKNPEIAKKYAMSILEEDRPKAILFLKQAAESFARSKDYSSLEEIWITLVQYNFEDIPFIEKIERILLSSRERSRIAILLFPVMEEYKKFEDWDKTIYFLKKILENEPLSQKARNDLIRAYKVKYANHSLLEEFLKMSEIGNSKKSVKQCIINFERNIVFDTNNYVLHRVWGVGKIVSISSDSDSIVVDFETKKNHKLSIQMALTSLKPLKKDHILIKFYESKNEVIELFQNNIPEFMVELLKSYDGLLNLVDIKAEIVGKFLNKNDDWSKWWSKAKVLLKKDPRIGFNPKKKDEIVYRQKPITLTEELTEKFNAQTDMNKKLDIALEALEVYMEAEGAVESFNHYYFEEEENKDVYRRLVAYIYLEIASTKIESEDLPRHQKGEDIERLIKTLTKEELITFSKQLTNIDFKKTYVNLIMKYHPAYTDIFIGILFEVPVKINKYVFSMLVSEEKYSELNLFIETVLNRSKDFPEIFLFVAKSIFSGSWNYKWLNIQKQDLVLRTFRLLKPLAKIEEKGTKLKNMAHDILFGNNSEIIKDIIKNSDNDFIRKIYALFKEVPYISDIEKEGLYNLINSIKENFVWEEVNVSHELETADEVVSMNLNDIWVTQAAYNSKKEEFNHLVNVEMSENSRDIGEAQEKGDLRENAEYKAAMEKQSQLQALAKTLDHELKSAKILDLSKIKTDKVNIGCTVKLKNIETSEEIIYSVLGIWDADTERNIISYQSPMGKALLGKKEGDIAIVNFESNQMNFKILEIKSFSF